MDTAVIGVAPLTVVKLDGGRRANVPTGSLVPEDADPCDVARLIDEGYLAVWEADELEAMPDPADPADPDGDPHGDPDGDPQGDPDGEAPALGQVDVAELLKGDVEQVLDAVGDDADLAARVLEAEQARSRPRTGVVKGMQEAIDAAQGGQS